MTWHIFFVDYKNFFFCRERVKSKMEITWKFSSTISGSSWCLTEWRHTQVFSALKTFFSLTQQQPQADKQATSITLFLICNLKWEQQFKVVLVLLSTAQIQLACVQMNVFAELLFSNAPLNEFSGYFLAVDILSASR